MRIVFKIFKLVFLLPYYSWQEYTKATTKQEEITKGSLFLGIVSSYCTIIGFSIINFFKDQIPQKLITLAVQIISSIEISLADIRLMEIIFKALRYFVGIIVLIIVFIVLYILLPIIIWLFYYPGFPYDATYKNFWYELIYRPIITYFFLGFFSFQLGKSLNNLGVLLMDLYFMFIVPVGLFTFALNTTFTYYFNYLFTQYYPEQIEYMTNLANLFF